MRDIKEEFEAFIEGRGDSLAYIWGSSVRPVKYGADLDSLVYLFTQNEVSKDK